MTAPTDWEGREIVVGATVYVDEGDGYYHDEYRGTVVSVDADRIEVMWGGRRKIIDVVNGEPAVSHIEVEVSA